MRVFLWLLLALSPPSAVNALVGSLGPKVIVTGAGAFVLPHLMLSLCCVVASTLAKQQRHPFFALKRTIARAHNLRTRKTLPP